MRNFGEVTSPKVKETNPKPHEVVLSDSEACAVISKGTIML